MSEAHVSAEQPQARQAPRVPSSHVDPGRPGDPARPSGQGSSPPLGVGLSQVPSSTAVWRIRDQATFAALRREGTRVRSGALAVTFLPGDADRPPRVAYAIGRAVGGAVVRNRLRRQLRAIVAEVRPRLASGAWLIGAGPAAITMSFGELRTTVFDLVGQAPGLRPASRR
jgi:ribonuclease P protein component